MPKEKYMIINTELIYDDRDRAVKAAQAIMAWKGISGLAVFKVPQEMMEAIEEAKDEYNKRRKK